MKLHHVFLLIVVSGVVSVESDCGCNKVNREPTLSERKEPSDTGTCNAKSKNKLERNAVTDSDERMTYIPADHYILGTNQPVFVADQESPERTVWVDGFYLDQYEVSNGAFQDFVQATNYETEAEKYGDSFVFGGLLDEATKELYHDYRVLQAEWWYKVNGTDWRHPLGISSNIEGHANLPVVHVSWNDAVAFCKWKNKRLPTENEWEAACRGKKKRRLFPWGDKLTPKDKHWMNIWQGEFPTENTKEDGFDYLAPVDEFRQNEFNLYNIVGNVWEWVQDEWDAEADKGKEFPNRVKKGGSYLCHKSYCYRYRCAARSFNTQESSAGNLGFRCARSDKN